MCRTKGTLVGWVVNLKSYACERICIRTNLNEALRVYPPSGRDSVGTYILERCLHSYRSFATCFCVKGLSEVHATPELFSILRPKNTATRIASQCLGVSPASSPSATTTPAPSPAAPPRLGRAHNAHGQRISSRSTTRTEPVPAENGSPTTLPTRTTSSQRTTDIKMTLRIIGSGARTRKRRIFCGGGRWRV